MRFRRVLKLLGAIVGVVLLFVAYRVFAVYEFRSVACVPRAKREAPFVVPPKLVVMTYNIEGHAALLKPHHIEEIAKVINQVRPDIVGLNEAHRGTWQARFDDHVGALQRLTGMKGTYGVSYKLWGGEFGNLILTRGDILAADVHELPGTGEPRTLLEAQIRIDGTVVDFYVTHLAAWGKFNSAQRGEQLECIREYVTTSAHPFVLVGDMNAEPETSEVTTFMKTQSVRLIGADDTPTHKVMNERIDLMFATPQWQVGSVRTLDLGPSDHKPVVAELVRP